MSSCWWPRCGSGRGLVAGAVGVSGDRLPMTVVRDGAGGRLGEADARDDRAREQQPRQVAQGRSSRSGGTPLGTAPTSAIEMTPATLSSSAPTAEQGAGEPGASSAGRAG